jgi:G protein pathway suppressor 2
MAVLAERVPLTREQFQTLQRYIILKRKKSDQVMDAITKIHPQSSASDDDKVDNVVCDGEGERDNEGRNEEGGHQLESSRDVSEQLESLRVKLEELKKEKHHLFQELKKVIHQEEEKKRQQIIERQKEQEHQQSMMAYQRDDMKMNQSGIIKHSPSSYPTPLHDNMIQRFQSPPQHYQYHQPHPSQGYYQIRPHPQAPDLYTNTQLTSPYPTSHNYGTYTYRPALPPPTRQQLQYYPHQQQYLGHFAPNMGMIHPPPPHDVTQQTSHYYSTTSYNEQSAAHHHHPLPPVGPAGYNTSYDPRQQKYLISSSRQHPNKVLPLVMLPYMVIL